MDYISKKLRIHSPDCDGVRTRETNRTVNLSDNLGLLSYKVSFEETTREDMEGTVEEWTVKVVTPGKEDDPIVVYKETYQDYKAAMDDFNSTIGKYTALVKAQSRPIDDMTIYSEKVGYRKMDLPKCCWTCANCRFEMKRCGGRLGVLTCGNPEVLNLLTGGSIECPDLRKGSFSEVRPKVEADWTCDWWKEKSEKDLPECWIPKHPATPGPIPPPPGHGRGEFHLTDLDYYRW